MYSGGGGDGGTSRFDAVLFTHWRDDYTAIIDDLLDTRFTAAATEAQLERASAVAGAAFAAELYVIGTMAEAVEALKTYWSARFAAVRAEVP